VKKVFVTGLAYDFCAGSTALDSAKAGFDTYIINESTRSVAPNFAAEMDAKIEKFSNIKKISVAEIDKYL
jgi:nicotinamidase/pyrazinamidase